MIERLGGDDDRQIPRGGICPCPLDRHLHAAQGRHRLPLVILLLIDGELEATCLAHGELNRDEVLGGVFGSGPVIGRRARLEVAHRPRALGGPKHVEVDLHRVSAPHALQQHVGHALDAQAPPGLGELRSLRERSHAREVEAGDGRPAIAGLQPCERSKEPQPALGQRGLDAAEELGEGQARGREASFE
jgi:hypothetical protein